MCTRSAAFPENNTSNNVTVVLGARVAAAAMAFKKAWEAEGRRTRRSRTENNTSNNVTVVLGARAAAFRP
jgi:hypothetical protein